MAKLGGLILIGLSLALRANSQDCSPARNCSACLDAAPSCQWCSDLIQFYQTAPRCATSFPSGCQNITNLPSLPLQFPGNLPIGAQVQVTPQRVSVTARSHTTLTVKANLEPGANFPLDVYYLMDHSFSFADDLITLKRQSANIANAIRTVSTNSRVGFGSFVDKVTEPFVLTQGAHVLSQCINCKVPYVFENTFPLSTDISAFNDAVDSQRISGNVDTSEGVLDAMVQALICTDKIGWRAGARRVLVVATDAPYHVAGDGALAGIVVPNNGSCQLNGSGHYTAWNSFDYPSIGQLNSIIQEENILVVFAVTANVNAVYEFLRQRIVGSVVHSLTSDSTNLELLLTLELERQISQAHPSVIVEDGVRVTGIRATCPGGLFSTPTLSPGIQGCNDLFVGSRAEFDITVEAGACAQLRNGGRAVVRFTGFGDVEVNVDGLCDCPCESLPPSVNSSWCFDAGNENCGLCTCLDGFSNEGRLGRCDCDLANLFPCIKNGSGLVCTGNGECVCQECQCKPLANGTFCECDNGACLRGGLDNELCYGNGVCRCGACDCNSRFVGEACECALDDQQCQRPTGPDNRVCSGQGRCQCGTCDCLSGYTGTYCETCIRANDQCVAEICAISRFCLDLVYNFGNVTDFDEIIADNPQYIPCSGIPVRLTEAVEVLPHPINGIPSTVCPDVDPDGCQVTYYVVSQSIDITTSQRTFLPLQLDSKKVCPVCDSSTQTSTGCPATQGKPFDYLPLVLGIVLGLLFAGIIMLLIWRIYTWQVDRQEYQRFMKEKKNQDWSNAQNPLFKKATQTFDNPTFGN